MHRENYRKSALGAGARLKIFTEGANNGLYYSFTTMKVPAEPPPTCPVYGWVFLEDGSTSAAGAIAYLQVVNGTGESYWISTPADFMGVWVLNLGNLYNTVTDDAMIYNAGDSLLLELQGGDGRVFDGAFVVPAVCPLFTGLITLSHYIDLAAQLNTGFNLIAFPFDPITDADFNPITPTACSLINDIPCEQAFSWNSATQSWLSAFDDGVNCIGDDFPIEAGKGYFIKVTTDTEATFYGKEIAYPLPLAFEPGLNLVSIPYPFGYYSACSLMEDIPLRIKAFPGMPDLQRWLSALVIAGGGCIGNDFSVIRESGYLFTPLPALRNGYPARPGNARRMKSVMMAMPAPMMPVSRACVSMRRTPLSATTGSSATGRTPAAAGAARCMPGAPVPGRSATLPGSDGQLF